MTSVVGKNPNSAILYKHSLVRISNSPLGEMPIKNNVRLHDLKLTHSNINLYAHFFFFFYCEDSSTNQNNQEEQVNKEKIIKKINKIPKPKTPFIRIIQTRNGDAQATHLLTPKTTNWHRSDTLLPRPLPLPPSTSSSSKKT